MFHCSALIKLTLHGKHALFGNFYASTLALFLFLSKHTTDWRKVHQSKAESGSSADGKRKYQRMPRLFQPDRKAALTLITTLYTWWAEKHLTIHNTSWGRWATRADHHVHEQVPLLLAKSRKLRLKTGEDMTPRAQLNFVSTVWTGGDLVMMWGMISCAGNRNQSLLEC